jgi:ketosteroid isomerase-like protein
MKSLTSFLLIIPVLFFLGCEDQKLSHEELEGMREEIRNIISEQSEAFETGNIDYFKNAVSGDIIGFGTPEEAVYTNPDEWAESFQRSFQSMDTTPWNIKFAEVRHLSIQISETGDMATAIYEEPFETILEGESHPGLLRMATTWRKENGEWKIVQWLAARPVE